MPVVAKMYDAATAELVLAFQNIDLDNLTDITLGGNSYDSESCNWIKQNVLMKAPKLTKVNFSNMFVTRLRSDLPISIKYLIEGLNIGQIKSIDLSDNAIGPEIKIIEKELSQAGNLKYLNLTNTGLGPAGSKIVADALLSNDQMQLTEMYISRSRLEDLGFESMGNVLKKQ
tara:strand:+ start:254 stop:769 length:516 start_codon:yes stop_codon:yes gene_type:complete